MPKEPLKILGINPGTRYLGIAVLQGAALREWGVKAIEGAGPKEKVRRVMKIVVDLIEEHQPAALAVKAIHPARSSPALRQMMERMKRLCKRRGLRIYRYSIEELKASYLLEDRANKRELAERIACEYPALYHELDRESAHKNPYHIRMFEAVGLASLCLSQLDRE